MNDIYSLYAKDSVVLEMLFKVDLYHGVDAHMCETYTV
jgi:hypothetical protein